MASNSQKAVRALNEVKELAERIAGSITLPLKVEFSPEGWDDIAVLVVDDDKAMAWVSDQGQVCIDATVDTSDPSVGMFGNFEPASWNGKNDSKVETRSPRMAALALVTCALRRHAEGDEDPKNIRG